MTTKTNKTTTQWIVGYQDFSRKTLVRRKNWLKVLTFFEVVFPSLSFSFTMRVGTKLALPTEFWSIRVLAQTVGSINTSWSWPDSTGFFIWWFPFRFWWRRRWWFRYIADKALITFLKSGHFGAARGLRCITQITRAGTNATNAACIRIVSYNENTVRVITISGYLMTSPTWMSQWNLEETHSLLYSSPSDIVPNPYPMKPYKITEDKQLHTTSKELMVVAMT